MTLGTTVYEAALACGWLPKPIEPSMCLAGKMIELSENDRALFTAADLRAESKLAAIVATTRFRKSTRKQQAAVLKGRFQSERDKTKAALRLKYSAPVKV